MPFREVKVPEVTEILSLWLAGESSEVLWRRARAPRRAWPRRDAPARRGSKLTGTVV